MRLYINMLLIAIISTSALGLPWTGVIADSRATDWGSAGVVGGIPSGTWTQCGSTIQAGASAATINSAIQNCAANHFVQLNAGTFNLNAGIIMKSGVVLKGMGADQTFLVFTGTDPCAGAHAAICFAGGDSSDWAMADNQQPGGSNTAVWSGGYTKDTNQITITNIGNSGIKVGQYIFLDQANDVATNSGLFVCETTGANPSCSVEGGAGDPGRIVNGIARQQTQIVRVTAISGNTYTISQPLHAPNWDASKSPLVWWPSEFIEYSGLEDLSLDATNAGGNSNIAMYNAANVWVSGTRQLRTCTCNRNIIWMAPATHVTIQNNYFYGTSGQSQNYGVETFPGSDVLVVNNIFQHVVSPMMVHANEGSVYAYNYAVHDPYDDGRSPQYHWLAGAIGLHSGGVMYNLFEGNIGPSFGGDYIHGNQVMNTVFRNYWLGTDVNRIDNLYAMNIMAWNRYFNVVGNVLGTPGVTNAYQNAHPAAYDLGGGYDTLPDDPLVAATMLRWGNYDTANKAVRWETSEVPSGLSQYANPVPPMQLPSSFYLSSKPNWWPSSIPWPPIGPDVTGGNLANLGGHAHMNPAMACYRNVMGGPVDGVGNPLSFNARLCYTTMQDPTAPSQVTGLSASAASQSEIDLSWSAATDPDSGVSNYKIYRNGAQVGIATTTSYHDVALTESTSYSYQVSAVNGGGLEGAKSSAASMSTLADSTRPTIVSATMSGTSQLVVVFSEPIEQSSATSISNYAINAVTVSGASLGTDLLTVTLSTGQMAAGTYTLTVNNIRDRAASANTILADSQKSFIYASGLLLALGMNEGTGTTTTDSTGKTGALTNGPSWTTGKYGSAVQFDGTNDKILLPSTIDFTVPLTIEAWIYPTSYSDWRAIFTKRDSPGASDMRLDLGLMSGTGAVYLFAGGSTVSSGYSPPLNTWTHVAVVVSSAGAASLYVNGALSQNFGTVNPGTDSGAAVTVGSNGDDDDPFAGRIDEVRVYAKALTQGEILVDMNTPIGTSASCHVADIGCDGCVDLTDLNGYVSLWMQGNVQIKDLMTSIAIWKNGC
jgi:hypothetical protein